MLSAFKVLIVDDDLSRGIALADAVHAVGGTAIGPVSTVQDALEVLDSHFVSAAILAALPANQGVSPIALRLADAGVPVIIQTSGLPEEFDTKWPDLPHVFMSASASTVVQHLVSEIDRAHLFALGYPKAGHFQPRST